MNSCTALRRWMGCRSHTKTILPRTNRRICLRKAITSALVRLCQYDLMLTRIFLPFNETNTTPRILRRSWCSMLVRMIGVCPRRAQVRLSGETREKPASSSSASIAFSSRTFFYLWQSFLLPFNDRFFISMQGATLLSLITPAHPIQHMPNRTRMVPYLEQLPDDLRNPVECPVIANIPESVCALIQCFFKSFDL